jgi:hypothetical protein
MYKKKYRSVINEISAAQKSENKKPCGNSIWGETLL